MQLNRSRIRTRRLWREKTPEIEWVRVVKMITTDVYLNESPSITTKERRAKMDDSQMCTEQNLIGVELAGAVKRREMVEREVGGRGLI